LKIIEKKSNFEEPLLQSCKNLSDYVKDDTLYNKHLDNKIDESFIDKLFDIQDNYLDNPQITKEINNLLCYLALRNPKLAEAITLLLERKVLVQSEDEFIPVYRLSVDLFRRWWKVHNPDIKLEITTIQ